MAQDRVLLTRLMCPRPARRGTVLLRTVVVCLQVWGGSVRCSVSIRAVLVRIDHLGHRDPPPCLGEGGWVTQTCLPTTKALCLVSVEEMPV